MLEKAPAPHDPSEDKAGWKMDVWMEKEEEFTGQNQQRPTACLMLVGLFFID